MDKARKLLRREPSYEPLDNGSYEDDDPRSEGNHPFSWIEYGIFLLVGIAMLWSWNMFLAAAPYFQYRFRADANLLSNFQATEISVSTLASLSTLLILMKLQAHASYPRRIVISLISLTITFVLLAISTKAFPNISAGGYFAFFVLAILASSISAGFMQNGIFSFVPNYNRPEYMQAILTGQAVAGVLPPLVQIISVLSTSDVDSDSQSKGLSAAAFAYFMTATAVSTITLLAFFYLISTHPPDSTSKRQLLRRRERDAPEPTSETSSLTAHDQSTTTTTSSSFATNNNNSLSSPQTSSIHTSSTLPPTTSAQEPLNQKPESQPPKQSIPLTRLLHKLLLPASSVILTFAITMIGFPVFTASITSLTPNASPILANAAFIPLAFLIWNLGDLVGRLIPLVKKLSLAHRPAVLLILSVLRIVWIPLYMVCNTSAHTRGSGGAGSGGLGANTTSSNDLQTNTTAPMPDAFYLIIVQFLFGLTNGYLGSCGMMGAPEMVEPQEREAAGGFMGLCLVFGLAVGSLLSFFVKGR